MLDARDDDLTRRRFRLAAAAGSWLVTRHPMRANRLPRTVMEIDGPMTLRAEPGRPHAARTLLELDTLLAFGVVPASVGSDRGAGSQPWRAIAGEADVAVVDVRAADAADRLRERGVDLVLVSDSLAAVASPEIDMYRDLDVPVVRLPDGDVAGQVSRAGAALGLAERADTLADEVRDRLRRCAAAVRSRSVSAFVADERGTIHVFTRDSPLGELLRRAGLAGPIVAGPAGAHTVEVPPGWLAALDADVLIGLETSAGALAGIEADPRFAVLPVVRRGGYRRLDPATSYAVAVPSVLTLPVALDAVIAVMAG